MVRAFNRRPDGAFVVIVCGIMHTFGVAGLMTATIMVGGMLIVFGFAPLGGAIKFMPYPVTTGFTTGMALIIALQQYVPFFGLHATNEPRDFIGKLKPYATLGSAINLHAMVLGVITLLILQFWLRVSRGVPAPLIALLVGTLAVPLLHLNVATIGSRFGDIRFSWPHFHAPTVDLPDIRRLLGGPRLASRYSERSSRCFPRSLIGLLFGKWVVLVPLPVLAGILLVVAYHMSEWRTFLGELKGPRGDGAVMLTTFRLTVLVDLSVAIQAGMVLAAFLFMRRMSEVTNVSSITSEFDDDRFHPSPERFVVLEGVEVFEINGPFFFGAAEKFKDTMNDITKRPRVLILGMRNVPAMDATGLAALPTLVRRSRKEGTRVILAGVHAQPMTVLARSVFSMKLVRRA